MTNTTFASKKERALKAGFWYTISNILIRALGIFTAPIFTRLLTPSDYGIFNDFTSWQSLIVIVSSLSLSYSVGRAKIDFGNRFPQYLSSIQALSTLSSTIVLIIGLLLIEPLSIFFRVDYYLLISLLVFLVFYPSIELYQSKLRFEYKFWGNIVLSLVNSLSVIVVSILLILFTKLPAYSGRALGSIVPTGIIAFALWLSLFARGKKFFCREMWIYALKICIPIIPHAFAMIFLAQIDRIMILRMVGESEAGIYSFGYSYAVIPTILINAISSAFQPWLYDNLLLNQTRDIKKAANKLNALIFVVLLGFITIAPEAIMVLGEKSFWGAKYMIAPVVIGSFFQYLYSNFSNIELYEKKTIWISIGSVLAALLNFGLNYWLIPILGYNVAAVTTLIGYAALMFFHWFICGNIIKRTVYDWKNIIFYSSFITVAGISISLLFDANWWIRYLLYFAVFVIVACFFRNDIGKLWKKHTRRRVLRA